MSLGDPPPALALEAVGFAYTRTGARVEAVSLSAPQGAVYGLLGPNGAGKTTLMRLMVGLLKPRSGHILIDGADVTALPASRRAGIGSLIEAPSLYEHLTAREHLRVFCHYHEIGTAAVAPAIETVGLSHAADQRVGSFSFGMKQRLGLATALLHLPRILVLDEPTNGLDPEGIADMRRLLQRFAGEGGTVIVSSHLLSEIEKMATVIAVLDRGRVRFEGSLEALRAAARPGRSARLRVSDGRAALGLLSQFGPDLDECTGEILLPLDGLDGNIVPRAIEALAKAGISIFEARSAGGELESSFLALLAEAE